MCSKQTESRRDVERVTREAKSSTTHPGRNTRPRGNQETDRRDLERGLQKLEALLGR
jgi:hypothetical protein